MERIKTPLNKRLGCLLLLGFAPFTIGFLNGAGEGVLGVASGGMKTPLLSYQRMGEEVWKAPEIVIGVIKTKDIGVLAGSLAIPMLLLGVAGTLLLAVLLLVDIPRNVVLSLERRRKAREGQE